MNDDVSPTLAPERLDLLEALRIHRSFLRTTAEGLTDDQARQCSTVSELTIGGLIKHVAATEEHWARFMVDGPDPSEAMIDWSGPGPAIVAAYADGFQMLPTETLAGILERYEATGTATDSLVATIDLDLAHPLRAAPWFEPGATRSARRTVLHIAAETAQHAGHADIIREAIDGHKTMG